MKNKFSQEFCWSLPIRKSPIGSSTYKTQKFLPTRQLKMKTATLILVLLATTCVFSFFTLNKVQPLVFQYLKTKQSKTNVLVLMNDFVNFETLTDKNGVHVSQLDHITQGRLVLQSVSMNPLNP